MVCANPVASFSSNGLKHVPLTEQELNSTERDNSLQTVQNSFKNKHIKIGERSLPEKHGIVAEKQIGDKQVSSKLVAFPQWNNMFLYNHLLPRAFMRPLRYPSRNFAFVSSSFRTNHSPYAKRDDILTDGIKVTPVNGIYGLNKTNNSTWNENKPNGESYTKSEMDSTGPKIRKRPAGDDENCMRSTAERLMKFQEHISTNEGQLLLTCTGQVTVKQCKGLCNSMVKPDVTAYDGFERSCKCCKDSRRLSRAVTLTLCDIASNEVFGYSLTRQIVEPVECACSECSRH
ncbi:uncharacterized protein LOC127863247 [Dreissena polymorpha]|nr:uncharacterized protein LOC127863247 [Dreissena polymorpha]